MQGIKRRVVYVTLYEAIAIVLAGAGFMAMSDADLRHAGSLSVLSSAVAVLWNVAFNHAFEWWEARQPVRGRSLRRRLAHALGFEGGLAAMLVPVMAWWLDVSLWHAMAMDLGLVLFFLAYTFVFNWVFDRVFGLPRSALPV
ncbi:PACE efflux transporter [uncultured Azohydromonas sp.]|jgi:Predicted membrane protein|uniref:PACE efflux transporter n=1 Tax=uncultured Azohydromonas sp. TaxID=487342 RepID=UPI0026186385|nr:PACE efflux transporter [uncultured Azohydromonas sp.]